MLCNSGPKTEPCGTSAVILLSVGCPQSWLWKFCNSNTSSLSWFSIVVIKILKFCRIAHWDRHDQMPSLYLEKRLQLTWIHSTCHWCLRLSLLFVELWNVGFSIQTVTRSESLFVRFLLSVSFESALLPVCLWLVVSWLDCSCWRRSMVC